MVPAFLHVLISSFLETSRRQIVASVTVRFSGSSSNLTSLGAAFVTLFAVAMPALAQDKTLYERLGGYDAISAVVDDFADRLVADPDLERHFGGFSADRLIKFKEFNTQLVCQVTGGPCSYQGRDMVTTHKGARIDDALFDEVAGNLVATLDKFKVPEPERTELLDIIGSLRGDIVE